jgi:peptide deformylase
MYEQEGCGLAAVQVGIPLRILTMDASRENNQPEVLINPEIIRCEGTVCVEEGCLSFPGISIAVPRAEKIWVKALNREGETIEFAAEDLKSRCIQHEIEHLDGIVFTDKLSKLKRERANKKVIKFIRAYDLDKEAS